MVSLNISWSKVGFSDEANNLITKLDDRSHTYPLIYVISFLEDGIVLYPKGYSRTLYIGRSERNSKRGRMRAHLNWMRKALLLNPKLSGFRVGISQDGDISNGSSHKIEGHCLAKFENSLGSIPLFNTNGARQREANVDFFNHRNMFRCSTNKGNAAIVVKARGEEQNG